jgi:hypothetical protein
MNVVQATAVFTPGAVPTYTYIPRDEAGLEQNLRDGLETPFFDRTTIGMFRQSAGTRERIGGHGDRRLVHARSRRDERRVRRGA